MLDSDVTTSGQSSVVLAANWLADLLTGEFGTTIAVLTVAGVGFAALLGRFAMRNSLRIVIGCFILFGAPIIAKGLMGLAYRNTASTSARSDGSSIAVPVTSAQQHFDPYAGASVPNQ